METKHPALYRALKQTIEVEEKLFAQCCRLQQVDHYCDLYDPIVLKRADFVVNLALEMDAKVGADRSRILLLHSPLPERFDN
ncbi:hypothetical protein KI387_024479, partial [Taxus chinensis]